MSDHHLVAGGRTSSFNLRHFSHFHQGRSKWEKIQTEEAVGHSNGLVVGHHEEEGELLPEQVKSFRSVITNKSPEAFEASSKRGGGVIFAHFVCLIYDSWKTAPWHYIISKVVTTFLYSSFFRIDIYSRQAVQNKSWQIDVILLA